MIKYEDKGSEHWPGEMGIGETESVYSFLSPGLLYAHECILAVTRKELKKLKINKSK